MEGLGDQLLTCAVCFEKLKEPKVLSCHHYFCQQCISQIATRNDQENTIAVACPECRCTSYYPNGMGAIPSAFFVNRLEDAIKLSLDKERERAVTFCGLCSRLDNRAIEFCDQCQVPICLKCKECHETMKLFKGHILSAATTRDECTITQQCSEHKESLKYFCCDCQSAICGDCIVLNHKSHVCKLLANVASDFMEELNVKQDKLRRLLEMLSTRRDNLKDLIQKLMQEAENLKEAIENTCSLLHSTIDTTKHRLLREIDDAVNKKLYHVKQEEEKTTTEIYEVSQAAATLNARKESLVKYNFTGIDLGQLNEETERVLDKPVDQKINLSLSLGLTVDMISVLELESILNEKCYVSNSQCNSKHFSLQQFPTAPVYLGEPLEIILSHKSDLQHCVGIRPRIVASLCNKAMGRSKQFRINHNEATRGHSLSITPGDRGQHTLNITINNSIFDAVSFLLNVYLPIDQVQEPVKIIHSSQSPWGVACFEEDLLAITAATSNGAILFVNTKSDRVIQRFTHQKLQCPCGITVDTDRNLYVMDAGTHSLLKFNKAGAFIKCAGEKGRLPCQFQEPTGIEHSSSKLFVCDRGNHCIKVFECLGLSLLWCIGKEGEHEGQLREPADICISAEGNILFITDLGNSRLQAFTIDGVQLFSFGHQIVAKPAGICVDIHRELVLVTDIQMCVVAAFNYNGQLVTLLGEQSEMNCPTGIVCDTNGFVYVCDHYGNCIFVY